MGSSLTVIPKRHLLAHKHVIRRMTYRVRWSLL